MSANRLATSALGRIRNQTSLDHLQIVVLGEIDCKVPGHGFCVAQFSIHYDAFDAVHDRGDAPGRIRQMTAGLGSAGAELAHHAT